MVDTAQVTEIHTGEHCPGYKAPERSGNNSGEP